MSKSPKESGDLSALSEVAPELAEMLVSVSSDIALVVDTSGVINSIALGGAEPVAATASDWVGRAWTDTVTSETRRKIEELLAEASRDGVSRTRHVNHPTTIGPDIPIAYTAVRLGLDGPLLAVGRDLRSVSAMQQRLIDTQQAMEKDYWRMRQAETRYRLLFQIATDPILVLDGNSLRVVDANRAAARIYGMAIEDLIGKAATVGLESDSQNAVERLLGGVRVTGRAAEAEAYLASGGKPVRMWITPFRAEGATLLLMKVQPESITSNVADRARARCSSLVNRAPDAVVFTDDSARILGANAAFVDLVKLADEDQVKGLSLSDWIGRSPSELPNLMASVKQSAVSQFAATDLRSAQGTVIQVEVSIVRIDDGQDLCIGFVIRPAAPTAEKPLLRVNRPIH